MKFHSTIRFWFIYAEIRVINSLRAMVTEDHCAPRALRGATLYEQFNYFII